MSIVFTHRRFGGRIENGTKEHPFLIKDAFDFIAFIQEIDSGNDFEGIYHQVVKDLDFEYLDIIGIKQNPYRGLFDGNFKTFKNINLIFLRNDNSVGLRCLFGDNYGTIKNLRFKNINIQSSVNYSSVICVTNYGNISNISVQGQGVATEDAFSSVLVELGSSNVKDIYSDVTINAPNSKWMGGIAACSYSQPHFLTNCFSKCNIVGYSHIGGICGFTTNSSQNTIVRNSVSAMSNLKSTLSGSTFRISAGTLNSNNYSLEDTMINNAIPTTNIGTNSQNGADATELQLKSTKFYRDVLGWDMDTIWEIEIEGVTFPRLRGFDYNF